MARVDGLLNRIDQQTTEASKLELRAIRTALDGLLSGSRGDTRAARHCRTRRRTRERFVDTPLSHPYITLTPYSVGIRPHGGPKERQRGAAVSMRNP